MKFDGFHRKTTCHGVVTSIFNVIQQLKIAPQGEGLVCDLLSHMKHFQEVSKSDIQTVKIRLGHFLEMFHA